jgi:hypothetical protein
MDYTTTLHLRKREAGSLLPTYLTKTWVEMLNEELNLIDAAVAANCTPEQIANIRSALKQQREGVIL